MAPEAGPPLVLSAGSYASLGWARLAMRMNRAMKHKIALGAVVATAAGGGVAWAATSSKSDLRAAYLDDVAKRLDVSSDQLTSALKGAYLDQLDAAVKAGRLTQSQADELKQRVQSGAVPFGPGGPGLGRGLGDHGKRFGFGRHGPFGSAISAAADFLGLSDSALQSELRGGRSLADIAKDKGKPEDDLIAALVAAEKKQLDQAVDDKRITGDQRDAIAKDLPARIKALVEGGPPAGGPRRGSWGARPGDGYLSVPPGPGADL